MARPLVPCGGKSNGPRVPPLPPAPHLLTLLTLHSCALRRVRASIPDTARPRKAGAEIARCHVADGRRERGGRAQAQLRHLEGASRGRELRLHRLFARCTARREGGAQARCGRDRARECVDRECTHCRPHTHRASSKNPVAKNPALAPRTRGIRPGESGSPRGDELDRG